MTSRAQAPGAAGKGPRDALRMELGRARHTCASQRGEARAPAWNKVSTVPRLIHVGKEAGVRGGLHFSVHSVRAQYTLTRAHLSLHSDAVAKNRNPVSSRK